jgi:hypothetical protein
MGTSIEEAPRPRRRTTFLQSGKSTAPIPHQVPPPTTFPQLWRPVWTMEKTLLRVGFLSPDQAREPVVEPNGRCYDRRFPESGEEQHRPWKGQSN